MHDFSKLPLCFKLMLLVEPLLHDFSEVPSLQENITAEKIIKCNAVQYVICPQVGQIVATLFQRSFKTCRSCQQLALRA